MWHESVRLASLAWVFLAANDTISVEPNVHVSKLREGITHNEVVIAAHPVDPAQLTIGAMLIRHERGVVVYRSTDSGRTWGVTAENSRAVDPAVTYGPAGTSYYADLFRRSAELKPKVEIARSVDDGKTWQPPVDLQDDFQDRPFLCVDHSRGPQRGDVYCASKICKPGEDQRLSISVSGDAGRTFVPVQHIRADRWTQLSPGQPAILSDGCLVMPYCVYRGLGTSNPVMEIRSRSLDRKSGTFSDRAVTVGKNQEPPYVAMPMLAADAGSRRFKDRLYLVWSQGTEKGQQVFVSRSEDGGRAWAKPRQLSEQSDDDSYSSVLPAVAVSPKGTVGVSWYDSRESRPGGPIASVRFCASSDGGDSWSPSVRVAEASSPVDLDHPFYNFEKRLSNLGDTAGLAADAAGVFHPVWVDKRTGKLQVFTTRVSVR